MLRLAALALGATFAISALAPQDAAAQSGRQRSEDQNRGVYVPNGQTSDGRVYGNQSCVDQDRYDHNRDDDRYDRDHHDNGKHKGWYKNGKADHDRDDRYDDHRYEDGRYSCNQSGYGYGSSMRNVGWNDVVLRQPRYGIRDGQLGTSLLEQVLGRSVFSRFDQQRYRLGVRAPLIGQWQRTSSGSLLNLFAGGLRVAEILDRNYDGRADVVLLNYGNSR